MREQNSLTVIGEALLYADTRPHPCWSCLQPVTLAQRGDADGECPHCGAELDLDTWPQAAVPEQHVPLAAASPLDQAVYDSIAANYASKEPAGGSVTLDVNEVAFLAARLRRLFKYAGYTGLADASDALVVGVAGTAIGECLRLLDGGAVGQDVSLVEAQSPGGAPVRGRGRPKLYPDAAARQKAYRDRKREKAQLAAPKQESEK